MNELNQQWFAQLPLNNISNYQAVSGGDINESYRIIADKTAYFIKIQPGQPATYFKHEINGLKALGQVVNTPTPLFNGDIEGNAYLILNWLDEGTGNQTDLGKAVAKLHHQLSPNHQFGFVDNHHTKALIKDNSWNPSWSDFYVHQRLIPEVNAAEQKGRWNHWRQSHFSQMVKKFEQYYQSHPVKPSLLHGDLWAGNFMFTANHSPYLIDPDALYGDREFDLAMTTIFGGFEPAFYRAYQVNYPFTPGIEERLPWYQFYYLCMHLILFGESYGPAVDNILNRY